MSRLSFGAVLSLAPLLFLHQVVSAQTPSATQTPPVSTTTAAAEATVTTTTTPAAATPTPPVATPVSPPVQPTPSIKLPVRLLSKDASLSSGVIQDSNGDGVPSVGDQPVATLIELQTNANLDDAYHAVFRFNSGGVSLLTDAAGAFQFTHLPPGSHVLAVWGGGGFIGAPTAPTNAGLFLADITVAADGSVTGALPDRFLLVPLPEGITRFPVRTGGEGGPVPVGTVDVRRALGAAGSVALPGTGDGTGIAGSDLARLVALGLLVAVAVITVVVGQRRLRRR